ncbi:LacI family DNA-binding transcriptional regulator [Dactylosporangium sp. NPDC051541]|uniref:LacI family DNA-binding transcriptional regulator n=1 Tax=Dactylosporangium sp. NPDC051541 TaxID=3363977 RepID=UPI0037A0C4AB
MGFAEKRGDYWRARYKLSSGKYGTVQDEDGATVRFRTRRAAEQAADAEEVKVREGRRRPAVNASMLFIDYVNRWYAEQDLAASTMQTYRRHIEAHILPEFGHLTMAELERDGRAAIVEWERAGRADYATLTVQGWRRVFHVILADAVREGLLPFNPASRPRGRGRVAGRSQARAPEKTITNALGVVLIAERMALLSGRDDEFVATVGMGFSGMRFGETVGLEAEFVRPGAIRVEWQLHELDDGVLLRCPPKDDSYRTIAVPSWLTALLREQIDRAGPKPCSCHGRTYVYRGHRPPRQGARQVGPRLTDVGRRAGVSAGTVWNALHRRDQVADATLQRVDAAVAELGYLVGSLPDGPTAPHWRRNGFATWLFGPAVSGWYPAKAPSPARPVPVLAEPWPGVPIRGRNAANRADACWVPVARDLTPHGLRHTYKTLMLGLDTPRPLMDLHMGHAKKTVSDAYDHVTADMVARLLEGLTVLWQNALAARRAMHPRSPVAVLDRLLGEESPA